MYQYVYVSAEAYRFTDAQLKDLLAVSRRKNSACSVTGLLLYLKGPCEKRDFQDWSMGFERLEGPEAETLPGYSDFLSTPAGDAAHQSAALRLLEFFKRIAR